MNEYQLTLVSELLAETGVDATCTYCQVTGQPIGFVTESVMAELFASIPTMDADETKDELLTRVLMSCRTSPAWLLLRRDTLDKLRLQEPRKVLSYLLNRLCTPIDNAKLHMSVEKRMSLMHSKIKLWNLIQPLEIDDLQLNKLLLILLELDARYNLERLAMPRNIPHILSTQSKEGVRVIIDALDEWLQKLVEKEIKDNKIIEESQRSYIRGNSVSKIAYFQELARQTPPGEQRVKALARAHNRERVASLIDEIEAELTRVPLDGSKPRAGMTQAREAIAPFQPVSPSMKLKAGFRFGGVKS